MDRDFSDHLFKPGNTKESLESVEGFGSSESNTVTGFGAGASTNSTHDEHNNEEDDTILSVDMFADMFGDGQSNTNTKDEEVLISRVGEPSVEQHNHGTKRLSLKDIARSSMSQQNDLLEKSKNVEVEEQDTENTEDSILNLGKKDLVNLLAGSDDLDSSGEFTESTETKQEEQSTSSTSSNSKSVKVSSMLKFFVSTDNMSPLEQKTHKLKLVVAVCLVGFLIVSCVVYGVQSMFGKKNDKETSMQTTPYPNVNNVVDQAISKRRTLTNETFSGLSDVVEDILIVEKYAEVNKDGLVLYLGGTTTKFKVEVSVPVTLETYNSITNGSLVKIGFKVIEIDNKKYCTEYNLMEVIE